MEIDPRFKQAKARAAQRRRNAWAVPLVVWSGGVLALGLVAAALYFGGVLSIGQRPAQETTGEPAGSAYASADIDLAGDPMLLHFDSGSGQKTRAVTRPVDLPPDRVGDNLSLLSDDLIPGEEELILTLPSSREDFAFFQAQRNVQPAVIAVVARVPAATGTDAATDNGQVAPQAAVIENSTSVALLVTESQRRKPYLEKVLRLIGTTDLVSQMTRLGIDEATAKRFAESASALVPEFGQLTAGYVLAIRATDRDGKWMPRQAMLCTRDRYFGAVAMNDRDKLETAADPWANDGLCSQAAAPPPADADVSRKYRMLDAFYSAALRNGVPSALVAQAIVMMSKSFDMDSFAAPGDRMTLVYSAEPGSAGPGPGQVLYASIQGNGKNLQCHVYKLATSQDYACFGKGVGGGGASGGVTLRPGFVPPVQGVISLRFGPHNDPVQKRLVQNNGVDWVAALGTPVVAAFDGAIVSMTDEGGVEGMVVKIAHAGGLETRYTHLRAFAEGVKADDAVKAGQMIGYVGTSGQSSGPSLHFELWENGTAVDPLGGDDAVVVAGGGSAVEQMVDQIIRVESGGKADAANPLSTAVGLGQFIESTWLRMMAQYRPDLATTLDRNALLALRTDPTLSREMVTALAREGESYLRAKGHEITAGRLYLCHFLGSEGANIVLNAQDDFLVVDVMGVGVVSANPFLDGKTIAYVKQWAEDKMSGRKGRGDADIVVPAEVLAYESIIATLLPQVQTGGNL